MDLIVNNLLIPVEQDDAAAYLQLAAQKLDLPYTDVEIVKILFKSLKTSDANQFYYELSLVVRVPASYQNQARFEEYREKPVSAPIHTQAAQRPVIIGFGPAGMFAALALIERGQKPLIFERGKIIEERHADVQRFISTRRINPESNIQFGEGGAGSYSDGKLFSRQNNSEYASNVLDTFITFGAPASIRYTSKPHLGTDVLRIIVSNMRKHILNCGGEIRYNSKMTDIVLEKDIAVGVVINNSEQYSTSSIYLAIGNSARDTFELLDNKGVSLESKPISVGVRIEHPASTINFIRYGNKYQDFAGIGAATYSFTFTNRGIGRGAYTFCMCPGGEVVNASSEQGMLALNGMSYAARGSAFSNSAIVVTCHRDDYHSTLPLAGIEFQKDIEKRAFIAGGSNWKTPAQNLGDFMRKTQSGMLNNNSNKMGVESAEIDSIFPGHVSDTLRSAFTHWKLEYPLFVSDDAILMAAETRTSSPVRILRGKNYQSSNIANLYPIGEGSGYTGGITSAAIDAMRAVEAASQNV